MELLGTVAAGLLVSVATSVVTVRLSLGRFYSERWWERRLDAYIGAHNALSTQRRQMKAEVDALEARYSGEEGNRPLPDDVAEEIRRSWRESERELEDALARGTFLLSEDAAALLERYQREQRRLDQEVRLYGAGVVSDQLEAVHAAVSEFGKLAKRDLGFGRFDLPWRRRAPVEAR